MVLPKKAEILERAVKKDLERQLRHGMPGITPEESELKESGIFQEAREDLMRDPAMVSEQLKYLNEMAGDMRLKMIPVKELQFIKKKTGYEWTNGWTKHEKKPERVSLRKPLDIGSAIRGTPKKFRKYDAMSAFLKIPKSMPHKGKHKKRHIQRTGKTMRRLRNIKGVKVFSFPDHIWKVRK